MIHLYNERETESAFEIVMRHDSHGRAERDRDGAKGGCRSRQNIFWRRKRRGERDNESIESIAARPVYKVSVVGNLNYPFMNFGLFSRYKKRLLSQAKPPSSLKSNIQCRKEQKRRRGGAVTATAE